MATEGAGRLTQLTPRWHAGGRAERQGPADTGCMGLALFLLIVVVPVTEVWVAAQVAHHIGVWNTVGLLILISMGGAWLLKQQGLVTWHRLQATLARGEMPGREIADGFLVLLGGALLLTPGFVTDAVGTLLLLPPTRSLCKGLARRVLGRWAARRTGVEPGRVFEARVVRSNRPDAGSSPPGPGPSLPRAPRREDDSPGTG